MKKLISCIIILFTFTSCSSQNINKIDSEFNLLNQHFKESNYTRDSLTLPLVHQNKGYSIQFENKSLNLNKEQITLSNPFSSGNFPRAFSFLYNGQLISLFDNGKFACHNMTNFKRNLELESKLNTKNFDYAWIIDGSIIAKYNYEYFKFTDDQKWIRYKNTLPFCNKNLPFKCKSKLFEDDQYLVYQKCQGEFGGTIYFYNKKSKKQYKTGAQCANSIIKKDSVYHLLSHLGHGPGTSDLQIISKPDELTQNGHLPNLFNFWEIQTFSSFVYRNQTIYMVFWRGATFLATFKNSCFSIVDPLFNGELYTHNPITTYYDDEITLINLDFYGKGKYREVSCVLIQGSRLTKIDWEIK